MVHWQNPKPHALLARGHWCPPAFAHFSKCEHAHEVATLVRSIAIEVRDANHVPGPVKLARLVDLLIDSLNMVADVGRRQQARVDKELSDAKVVGSRAADEREGLAKRIASMQ